MSKKISISPRFIAVLLAVANFSLLLGIYVFVRSTINSRLASIEQGLSRRYDALVSRVLADGLREIGEMYTNNFTNNLSFAQISSSVSTNVNNFVDNVSNSEVSPSVINDTYSYFIDRGRPTIFMRGNYYSLGDEISPFGEITAISPWEVSFSGGYVIKAYKEG